MKDVVIISACSTAIGTFGRALRDMHAIGIASVAMKEAIRRAWPMSFYQEEWSPCLVLSMWHPVPGGDFGFTTTHFMRSANRIFLGINKKTNSIIGKRRH